MTLPFDVLARVANPAAARAALPLHGTQASRQIEQAALQQAAPHALMARAGLSLAKLARAVAPAARHVCVLAGPGNNGGDGWVAARWLHQAGLAVQVRHLTASGQPPADAAWARGLADAAGVPSAPWTGDAPGDPAPDLIIDALLGLGSDRSPQGLVRAAIEWTLQQPCPVLAVDLPSGLSGQTGALLGDVAIQADHTLSLLTLKPGLFTGQGRDHAGRIWLDDLGCTPCLTTPPDAWLGPGAAGQPARLHGQHKGSFGDVLVLGGAAGMAGAALLAARAALAAGAGRTLLARLDGQDGPDATQAELMPRTVAQACQVETLQNGTVVCGCGGGQAVQAVLPAVLQSARKLVLDADALNAVAREPGLQALLRSRSTQGHHTVLTPHPLEAARLLGGTVAQVQGHRLAQSQALAEQFACVVVLKGSGTVIAAPGRQPVINPSGNARLGSGGTGDVLAGWLGGLWSPRPADQAFEASAQAVWMHGAAAQFGDLRLPLRASDLIERLAGGLLTGH